MLGWGSWLAVERCPPLSTPGALTASPSLTLFHPTRRFISFYQHKESVGCAPTECILEEGEILFVPVRPPSL